MADIFDEVGEDLRRERMKRLWQSYGLYVVAAAVLVVLGTAGWRAWQSYEASRAASAGAAYREALAPAAEGDHAAAADALVAFSSSAPGGYQVVARMRTAAERAAAGEVDTALATYEAVAGNAAAPQAVRDLATVRAAMLAVDRESLDAVRARLAPLDVAGNVWRHAARELVAVAALKAEDYAAARAALDALTADVELPVEIRQRASLLEDVVRSAIGEPPADGEQAS